MTRDELFNALLTTTVPHTATMRRGVVGPGKPGHRVFESNFVIECTCGERVNVASLSEAFAERSREQHLARHARLGETRDPEVVVIKGDTDIGHTIDLVEADPAGVVVIRTAWRP